MSDLTRREDVLDRFDGTPHVPVQMSYEEAREAIFALPAVTVQAQIIAERDQWIQHAKNAVWADSEEVKLLAADNARLRATAIQTPDYCYDEWESTMPWDRRNELLEFADLTRPVPVYTLFKGPTQWAVNIPIDTDGDEEADDFEPAWFDSEAEALAALNTGKDSE